jgi:hypothetical protein
VNLPNFSSKPSEFCFLTVTGILGRVRRGSIGCVAIAGMVEDTTNESIKYSHRQQSTP